MDYQYIHIDQVKSDGSLGKPNTFRENCKYFAGKDVEIMVRKKRAKRSNDQNRLYRAYCKLISEHTGYSEDEVHSIIGYKFRRIEKTDEQTGEIFTYIRSTTQYNKMTFADHLTEIQQWVENTFHFRLPCPGENWEISLPE